LAGYLFLKKLLLIRTGGTIAMEVDCEQKSSTLGWSDVLLHEIPELNSLAELVVLQLMQEDSSNINHSHWTMMANTIWNHYYQYDGFVILHGTDTMAYTASALSFSLRNLNKPVILTGSQLPIAQMRSDARRNLINAIELATMEIPEVAICFNDYLYRGNRSTKMSIGDFDAFASPNYPPLAEVGIQIKLKSSMEHFSENPEFKGRFSDELLHIKLHPNLRPSFLDCINLNEIRAIVVEAFGSGNFPIHGDYSFLPFLERCAQKNIIVLIASQAPYDSVDLGIYEAGRMAKKLGALSACDMTVEASVTKLMHLMGNYTNPETIKKLLNESIAGEITL